jgi:hypothetical protein
MGVVISIAEPEPRGAAIILMKQKLEPEPQRNEALAPMLRLQT